MKASPVGSRLVTAAVVSALLGCGARTELESPELAATATADAGADGASDAGAGVDGSGGDGGGGPIYCGYYVGPVDYCPDGWAMRCSPGRECLYNIGHDGLWGCCTPENNCLYGSPGDGYTCP